MSLKPTNNYVLVELVRLDPKGKKGMVLTPDGSSEAPYITGMDIAHVVAVGPKCEHIKAGDYAVLDGGALPLSGWIQKGHAVFHEYALVGVIDIEVLKEKWEILSMDEYEAKKRGLRIVN